MDLRIGRLDHRLARPPVRTHPTSFVPGPDFGEIVVQQVAGSPR
ncbi:hypothetical protein [Nonomuraea indica]|nr:hypothetical protein [Nonomuraea indica]